MIKEERIFLLFAFAFRDFLNAFLICPLVASSSTSKIIGDSRIDHVLFTGSVSGGKEVKKSIGTRFIGAGLELGGTDPAYVRYDCNLEHAIENLVDGSYFNSGQSCCGIERIYVDEKIYEKFSNHNL